MILIPIILAAMAVGLGGLFLLAKTQKENLGKLFSISSYVVITTSILIIVFGIAIAIAHCCCKNQGGCDGQGKSKCEQAYGKCHKGGSSCSMMSGSCSSGNSCFKGSSGCSKGASCKMSTKSCSMKSSAHCKMGSGCSMSGKCVTKKVIKTVDGDKEDIKVEIEEQ